MIIYAKEDAFAPMSQLSNIVLKPNFAVLISLILPPVVLQATG